MRLACGLDERDIMNSKNISDRKRSRGLILTIFTAVLLSVTVSAVLLSDDDVNVSAYETVDAGNFTLEYDIVGDEATIVGYLPGGSGDLVIPETVTVSGKTYPVTRIGDSAFYKCDSLTSVDMRYIKTIEYDAFGSCTALRSVDMRSVEDIGSSAFARCVELRVADMDSLINLGGFAFYGCVSLYSVDLGTAETLGQWAFMRSNLTSITIPATVKYIGRTFMNCFSLKEMCVDSGNQNYVMDGDVLLNKSKTEIVFCLTSKTGSYVMPSTVTSVGTEAFYGCSELTSVVGDSLRSVGMWAFASCSKLTSIDLSNVTDIDYCAFENCGSLRSVNISSLVNIEGFAFQYGGLASVTIPASATNIDSGAFTACYGLTNIIVAPTNPNYCSEDGVLFNKAQTEILTFPAGKTGDYVIPSTVSELNGGEFSHCSLSKITIPKSVTFIDPWTDFGSSSLIRIDVVADNEDYKSIDGVLFTKDGTELLAYPKGKVGPYTIPSGVTSLGYRPFFDCIGLTSVTVPGSIRIWGDEFDRCINLTEINIEDQDYPDRRSIDGVLFTKDGKTLVLFPMGRSGHYDIPSTVTAVSVYAFLECKLESVSVPASVASIEFSAFGGCSSLLKIDVAADNENYMSVDGVLFTKDGKTLITFPAGKTGVYVVPSSVEEIEEYAFSSSKLSGLTILPTVTSVAYDVFPSSELGIVTAPEGLNLSYSMPKTKVVRYNGDVVVVASIDGTTVTLKFMPENGEIIDDIVVEDVSGKMIQDRRWMNEWTFDIGTNNQVYVSATVRDAPESIETFAGIAFVAGFIVLIVTIMLLGARGKL